MNPARIIVLVVALAAGGLAAFLAASGTQNQQQQAPKPSVQLQTIDVLVAKADIGMGQPVSADDMQWQIWPAAAAGPSFIRKADRPSAIQQFAGSIARSPFVVGEPIREAKLIKANGSGFMAAILPPGKRAISTEISPETGAGGFILPNDHVDVILTRRDRESERAAGGEVDISETLLKNVRVLAIDQTIEEKNGQRVVVGKTATLELLPREAETLALARKLGTLSLALRSIADDKTAPLATTPSDDEVGNRRFNLVRFGVTTPSVVK
jgi:pilus assembly protein CpaB